MAYDEIIRRRCSIRKYAEKPVEEEKLNAALEAGRIAHAGANKQLVRVYALTSDEALAKVRSLTPCAFNASVVLLVTFDSEFEWKNPFTPYASAGQQDAAIAGTQMMLEATNLGLGSCWVSYFDFEKVHDAFELPASERLLFMLPFGYAAEGQSPNPRHTDRNAMDIFAKRL